MPKDLPFSPFCHSHKIAIVEKDDISILNHGSP
jgi:hypothetical protein